jgi:hypothetical protein
MDRAEGATGGVFAEDLEVSLVEVGPESEPVEDDDEVPTS